MTEVVWMLLSEVCGNYVRLEINS